MSADVKELDENINIKEKRMSYLHDSKWAERDVPKRGKVKLK